LAAFPDRPIRLIVPFAAGGNADIVGRLVGERISNALGQPVVVDNRGGAGGSIGAEAVARSTPDGYTLLVGSNGPLTVNPFVQAKLGYDPLKDFIPIALTSYAPHCIILGNTVAAKTLPDLIAQSKKEQISIATSGVGSSTHMTLERFKAATGANVVHVPYRSGGALMPDLIGGSIQAAMTEFSTALPLHKGGQAHIVAVALTQRSQQAPDVATFIEGGVKDFTASSFIAILAPTGTPADIVAQLQKAIENGLHGGTTLDRLRDMGSEIATPEQMTSAGCAAFIREDYKRMAEAAKLAGLEPK
jgi:tripartite-type tricarboxylate transporter receptor subunit TctC